jgi:hypothetical protein
MSQENVEFVRRIYAATPGLDPDPAADLEFLDRMFHDFLDADLSWRLPPEYPEGARLAPGREGMRAGDRVLVFVHVVAVGRESGVPIDLETAHLWTIRDGRAKSARIYRDRSEALEAVGLQE